MIVDEGHGTFRLPRHQRVREQISHIVISARVRRVEEMIVKRYVKEPHLVIDLFEVVQKSSDVAAPVLADGRNFPSLLFTDIFKQLPVK